MQFFNDVKQVNNRKKRKREKKKRRTVSANEMCECSLGLYRFDSTSERSVVALQDRRVLLMRF